MMKAERIGNGQVGDVVTRRGKEERTKKGKMRV